MAKKTLKKGKKNRKTKKRGGMWGKSLYRGLHRGLLWENSKGQKAEEEAKAKAVEEAKAKAEAEAEAEAERRKNPKIAFIDDISKEIYEISNACKYEETYPTAAIDLVKTKVLNSEFLSPPEKKGINLILNKIENSDNCVELKHINSKSIDQLYMDSDYVKDLLYQEKRKYDASFYNIKEKIKEIIDKCKSETVYPESYIERLKEEILTSTLLNKEEKRELQIELLTAKNSQNCKQLKQNQKKNGDHSSRGVNVREESRIGDGKPKRRQPVYKHNGKTALLTNRSKPSEHLPAEPDVQSKPEPEPKLKPDYKEKDFNKLMSDKKADIELMFEDGTTGTNVMNKNTGIKEPSLYVALHSLRKGIFNIYGDTLPEDKKKQYIKLVDNTINKKGISYALNNMCIKLKHF